MATTRTVANDGHTESLGEVEVTPKVLELTMELIESYVVEGASNDSDSCILAILLTFPALI